MSEVSDIAEKVGVEITGAVAGDVWAFDIKYKGFVRKYWCSESITLPEIGDEETRRLILEDIEVQALEFKNVVDESGA